LRSYDSLLESDPEFRQSMAEAQQRLLMVVVKARFPTLVEQAQQKVVHLHNENDLSRLAKLIAGAPDEKIAHWVLNTFAA
jgi:hypothetical protein